MTFLEKLYLEHPELKGKDCEKDLMCPSTYGYEDKHKSAKLCNNYTCKDCWNRELPEDYDVYEDCRGVCIYTNKGIDEYPCTDCKHHIGKNEHFTISKPEEEPFFNFESPLIKDNVNHPNHYQGANECIDVMLAMFGVEAVKHFCMCNAYKYRFRSTLKNGEEDIKKAEWYESKLIELGGVDNV